MSDLSGRELDAVVCGMMEARPAMRGRYAEPSGDGWWVWRDWLHGEGWLPRPVSTDIAWAMRAYGVMNGRGWQMDLKHEEADWRCVLIRFDEAAGAVLEGGLAPTPAEAICRAIVEAGGE